ncbi:fimbria/pilus periplasmic chaperone [Enterobacter cloacae complex sp. I2]|uniref:fimbria/pilus periplasmic chaperone n=1 Tax=Enterobacter cloacae complex sp. I2 TaxID=2779603 RepID=UPI0018671FA5|nr:fimbria/pilus periplasmic chaperone [Enterobacter cloacae complex sp. I2]
MKLKTLSCTVVLSMTALMAALPAQAAITLDRTRVIFDGSHTSESVSISNQNKTLPYLAQAWVEDTQGNKIENPLTALPPLQRVEPGAKSQIKLQLTGGTVPLAQDKESLYYFNLREIPPKSDKPNTLQIALQTRVKLFYRPAALALKSGEIPQEALTLTRNGDRYTVNNPTGYYVTIVHAAASEKGADVAGFNADMVAPKASLTLGGSAAALGSHPVLTYINDYGGRPKLIFSCSGSTCKVTETKVG